jgi:hypothetical protein
MEAVRRELRARTTELNSLQRYKTGGGEARMQRTTRGAAAQRGVRGVLT